MSEREYLEDMEKELLVDRYMVDYEGIFDYNGIQKMIDEFCRDNDFYFEIVKRKEKVTPYGRDITIEYIIQRRFKLKMLTVIYMELEFEEMEDEDIEIDGRMQALNKGKVTAVFHSFYMTSIKARWETKGYFYFLRGFIDKFIYKIERPEYRGIVVGDTYKLINEIKGFLNIYSHVTGGTKPTGRLKGGWV